MATFKLGAIITSIKGSIGGTSFRTNGATNVIQNKSRGTSRTRLLQNDALVRMANIFQRYGALSSAQKTGWINASLLYQFPDKFGSLKYLSSRQLFIKLTAQLYPMLQTPIDSTAIVSTIAPFAVSSATWDISLQAMLLSVSFDAATTCLLFQVEYSIQPLREPVFDAKQIVAVTGALSPHSASANANFAKKLANVTPSYNARLYVICQNIYGFRSVPLILPLQIIP
jgi:hypothetical protein